MNGFKLLTHFISTLSSKMKNKRNWRGNSEIFYQVVNPGELTGRISGHKMLALHEININ